MSSTQNQLHVCACCNSLGQQLCQAQRDCYPGGVCSVGSDFSSHITSLAAPTPANQAVPAHRHGYCCTPISADSLLACSGNHVVNTLPSISILLECPVLASIPGHCSRESIRQGRFPEIRIDESMMLRRGKESLAIWMQASPFALVLTASAMW